jgi:hypothetical protein
MSKSDLSPKLHRADIRIKRLIGRIDFHGSILPIRCTQWHTACFDTNSFAPESPLSYLLNKSWPLRGGA